MAAAGPITAGIGIFTQLAGTAQTASSYNSAGKAALSTAQYNSKLIDINLGRQLDQIALELRSFSSAQQAQIAQSGVSVTSKSALYVMSETLDSFEREVVLAKENAKLEQTREQFVARQQQEAFRQQRTSSIFEGIASSIFGGASLFSSLSNTGGTSSLSSGSDSNGG